MDMQEMRGATKMVQALAEGSPECQRRVSTALVVTQESTDLEGTAGATN